MKTSTENSNKHAKCSKIDHKSLPHELPVASHRLMSLIVCYELYTLADLEGEQLLSYDSHSAMLNSHRKKVE